MTEKSKNSKKTDKIVFFRFFDRKMTEKIMSKKNDRKNYVKK